MNTTPWYRQTHCESLNRVAPTTITLTVPASSDLMHPYVALIMRTIETTVRAAVHFDELEDVPKAEMYYVLDQVRRLASTVEGLETVLIEHYRNSGASYAELASALDISRAAAQGRVRTIRRAHNRSMSERGLRERDQEFTEQIIEAD